MFLALLCSFSNSGGFTHGLRRGLYSFAASRLPEIRRHLAARVHDSPFGLWVFID